MTTPHDEVRDEEHGVYTLTVYGLTRQQYDALVQAVKPQPVSKLSRFAGKAMSVAVLMLLIAGVLWLIAAIVTNLPGR